MPRVGRTEKSLRLAEWCPRAVWSKLWCMGVASRRRKCDRLPRANRETTGRGRGAEAVRLDVESDVGLSSRRCWLRLVVHGQMEAGDRT